MGFLDRLRTKSVASTPLQPFSAPPAPTQQRFAVVDIETTGLSPNTNRILSIAVVSTDPDGRVLDEWSSLVNPQGPVGATHVHGITENEVADAPVFHDVIADLTRRLAGAALVAHNATFDLSFLRAEYERAGWSLPPVPHLCTMEASLLHLPQLDRRRLADCCWAIGTPLTGHHSALGDARATAVLLAAFMHPSWGTPPPPHHVDLPARALTVPWPNGPIRDPHPSESPALPDGFRWKAPAPAAKTLVSLVDRFSLSDALDEGAPAGTVAYLETLAEALEDGELSDDEVNHLKQLADGMGLADADVLAANQAFVLALAHEAIDDGKVSRGERAELATIAALLGVDPKVVPALLDRAEIARERRLSEGLAPLPEGWSLGEPLRVGDKVVITGCEAYDRSALENRAEAAGVRIVGSVSSNTTLLVSDGTVDGTKAAEARFLGIRVVHPTDFATLLDNIQAALPREAKRVQKSRMPKAAPPRYIEQVRGASAPELPEGVTPADVRAWGRDNGWEVGVRGRLNHDLLEAYVTANLTS
ncbi:MAG TPA: exonuclease domain-containing protein [Nocardioidaceae bacterium]|nr:exonuclease domain-containing protein [Nocardioidaceae bacterium]